MNIARLVLATYVGIFFTFKWYNNNKAKSIQAAKRSEKENVVRDALTRSGLA